MDYYNYLIQVRDNIKSNYPSNLSHIDEFANKYKPVSSDLGESKPKLKIMKPILKIKDEIVDCGEIIISNPIKKALKFNKAVNVITNKSLDNCFTTIKKEKIPEYKSMKLDLPDNQHIRIIL